MLAWLVAFSVSRRVRSLLWVHCLLKAEGLQVAGWPQWSPESWWAQGTLEGGLGPCVLSPGLWRLKESVLHLHNKGRSVVLGWPVSSTATVTSYPATLPPSPIRQMSLFCCIFLPTSQLSDTSPCSTVTSLLFTIYPRQVLATAEFVCVTSSSQPRGLAISEVISSI